ncbi:MAG: TIGR04084 family radical SAM/SPASM domain-containing protein [Candidatus Thorarchaeota archaeon]|nr:MAG: TIGR04084 family radical SAM/SPASM domain-containing protein [Candidatus Thorarchaeota archaeon]
MNYHLILTRQCNLNCVYCHGGEEDGNTEIQYSIDNLSDFLKKDRTNISLLFYGGEPTLRVPLIIDLIDRFPKATFMLQTNGLLVSQLPEDYIKRFHSILVSIDGTEETTDRYRSKGVYQRVIKNVRWLREIGYEGDLVARMAVSEQSDIYRDVRHLVDLGNPSFDHVHWQLNVVCDAEGNWNDFDGWVEKSYNPGITMLVEDWVSGLEEGRVQGIAPFLPVMHTILTGERTELRCGSGLDTFAIHVDGSIGVCPISPDWEFSIVGDIRTTRPEQLRGIMRVEDPCPTCDIEWVCGGRCLFANRERLWGDEGLRKVCKTVRHLIESLQNIVPRVQELIENEVISLDQLSYPVNNGCEVIP